jgi:hypothetical protein
MVFKSKTTQLEFSEHNCFQPRLPGNEQQGHKSQPAESLPDTYRVLLRLYAVILCLAKTSYTRKMNDLAQSSIQSFSHNILAMIVSLPHLLGWMVSAFLSREDLVLENLALRRQLLALHA